MMDQSFWRIDEGGLPGCPAGTVVGLVQDGTTARVMRDGTQVVVLTASTTEQTSTPDGSSITLVNETEGWRAVLTRAISSPAPTSSGFCIGCGASLPPDAQFCATCGRRVGGDSAPPVETDPLASTTAGPGSPAAGEQPVVVTQQAGPRRISPAPAAPPTQWVIPATPQGRPVAAAPKPKPKMGLRLLGSILLILIVGAYFLNNQRQQASVLSVVGTELGLPGVAGWQTSLAATTCADYQHSMTSTQQVAAAAWMLAIFRRGEVTDASDDAAAAPTFAGEVGAACTQYYSSTPTTGVIAAATLAYINDPSLHPVHH